MLDLETCQFVLRSAELANIEPAALLAFVDLVGGGPPFEADGRTPSFSYSAGSTIGSGVSTSAERIEWLRQAIAEGEFETVAEQCDWGFGRIPGSQVRELGFDSVSEFFSQLELDPEAQVRLFVLYLSKTELGQLLNRHRWRKIVHIRFFDLRAEKEVRLALARRLGRRLGNLYYSYEGLKVESEFGDNSAGSSRIVWRDSDDNAPRYYAVETFELGPRLSRFFNFEDNTRLVEILVASTREIKASDKFMMFTEKRSSIDTSGAPKVNYGAVQVRVPESHRIGKVERPSEFGIFGVTLFTEAENEKRHFVIRGITALSKIEFYHRVESYNRRSVLIYVHGFNNSFAQSSHRMAQIVWDTQYVGVPILFSWASIGRIDGYIYDRESAELAIDGFVELLMYLQARKFSEIHIIAHSMGNQIVTGALAKFPRYSGITLVKELIMAAPDVDRDIFIARVPKLTPLIDGATLYASSLDFALRASDGIAKGPRAGDVTREGPVCINGVDTIDVTALGARWFSLKNHALYADRRNILNDVARILLKGDRPPNLRTAEIRGVPEGGNPPKYWRFVP